MLRVGAKSTGKGAGRGGAGARNQGAALSSPPTPPLPPPGRWAGRAGRDLGEVGALVPGLAEGVDEGGARGDLVGRGGGERARRGQLGGARTQLLGDGGDGGAGRPGEVEAPGARLEEVNGHVERQDLAGVQPVGDLLALAERGGGLLGQVLPEDEAGHDDDAARVPGDLAQEALPWDQAGFHALGRRLGVADGADAQGHVVGAALGGLDFGKAKAAVAAANDDDFSDIVSGRR